MAVRKHTDNEVLVNLAGRFKNNTIVAYKGIFGFRRKKFYTHSILMVKLFG